MDTSNPAVAKHFVIPPALVEAVHDDANAIQPSARVMAFKLAHEMFVESPNYTPAQKLALNDHLAKLGGLGQKQVDSGQGGGGGVSITINIPTIDDQPSRSIIIEQAPEQETVTIGGTAET